MVLPHGTVKSAVCTVAFLYLQLSICDTYEVDSIEMAQTVFAV